MNLRLGDWVKIVSLTYINGSVGRIVRIQEVKLPGAVKTKLFHVRFRQLRTPMSFVEGELRFYPKSRKLRKV